MSESREKPVSLGLWEKCVLAAVVTAVGVVSLLVIGRESVTTDEAIYIPVGMSYLQQHDGRMNFEHPPLEKVLAAIPLVLEGARPTYGEQTWASLGTMDERSFGEGSLHDWGVAGAGRIYLARVPMVLLTMGLAISVFWMARSMAGTMGGFLSLAMFAGSPFYYAYGPLVLTDVGVALFALLAAWSYASLWRSPSLSRAVVFGFAFAGALLSKFSSGLLLPIFVLFGAWYALEQAPRRDVKRAAGFSLAGVGVACIVVYVTYAALFWKTDVAGLMAFRAEHSTPPKPAMAAAASLFQLHPWIEKLSYPAVLYAWGVANIFHGLVRPTYLLGKIYPHGTARFFPTMFLYKMTLGFLLLSALLLSLWIFRLIRRERPENESASSHHVRAVAVLFFAFSLAAVFSSLDLGIRYLSIPIVALTVLISLVVPWSKGVGGVQATRVIWALVLVAVAASLGSTLAAFPHYLGYFNALNTSKPNYQISIGSDLDWGQTLIELRDLVETNQGGPIKIDVRGSVPAMYLPATQEFACEDGLPADAEFVAIGASRFVTTTGLQIDPAKPLPRCGYLFNYPHWANRSGSLYIFRVKPAAAAATAGKGQDAGRARLSTLEFTASSQASAQDRRSLDDSKRR